MPTDATRKRLCPNCLVPATGLYCGHCGQKQKSSVRPFRRMLGEFFNDILNLDAKLLRTLKPLLLNPGFLSREYFADRRLHYVTPLKLYFFLSIVTFFLIQQRIDTVGLGEDPVQIEAGDGTGEDFNITNFNGRPWHAKTNPIQLAWLPDVGNDLINNRLGKLESALKQRDWTQLSHAALAATPQALLLILPFFALLLKLVYFRNHLYAEHLVVALHNHGFLLLAITALVVIDTLGDWIGPLAFWPTLYADLTALVWLWVPVYFLLTLKRIYRQGWRMTLFKFSVIAFVYLFLLALGFVLNLLLAVLFL
jgi:Protein of unknown function (DUF3667)